MRLVGHNDLQARTAYQPTIVKQGTATSPISATTAAAATSASRSTRSPGSTELNGTSIVDVTDPKQPKYLAHIPGAVGDGEAGAAQMTRVCDGKTLGKGDPNKVYLLRAFGREGHETWDVTDPAKPKVLARMLGMTDTHKNYWECEGGIAYLVSTPPGWRTRMTQVYDLSDPANPVKIRDFGLVGQQPGATGAVPAAIHGLVSTGPKGNRVYLALRHQQGRHHPDRRSREAAEGSEGADARQPALSAGRPARHVAARRRRTPPCRSASSRSRNSPRRRKAASATS